MKFNSFLILMLCSSLSLAQTRKAEIFLESGYHSNIFKSPEYLERGDSLLLSREMGGALGLGGEWDVRLQWGDFLHRKTRKHQLDFYHTLRTRQFMGIRDASSTWADVQGIYRFRPNRHVSWMLEGGYTRFITPEELKTPIRNIISFGFQRWEAGIGGEYMGWKNHLSRLSLTFVNKDYTYQNSLDRKEYALKWYARQRFRKVNAQASYLRLNSYILYRPYENTQGSGLDEEGFDIVAGKRRLLQIQSELSYHLPLYAFLNLKAGMQYRYRNDIFPNRFDYQHLRPYVSLDYEQKNLAMEFNMAYTRRSYQSFLSTENSDTFLRYQYLRLQWEGEFSPPRNRKFIPYWRAHWDSRTSNDERLSRISFRGYNSWSAFIGLRVKWQ